VEGPLDAGPTDAVPPSLHDLACVVHVHSTFSDGTATVPEIAAAARRSGADGVLLTDHDTMEAKRRGLEGWHDDVLVLVGVEVSPPAGHLLAFGLDEEIDHAGLGEDQISAAVASRGALGFPAHPFSEGSRMSRRIGRPHPWAPLAGGHFTGIEVWSLVTEAAESWASPLEALRFLRSSGVEVDGPPTRNLAGWDSLCTQRRCVGIAGLDSHQSGVRLPGGRVLSPLPHERFFAHLRTHVLCAAPPTGDVPHDRALVFDALREGRCYMSVDGLADARGFAFWAEGDEGVAPMGARASLPLTLRAELPRPASVRVLGDGRELARRSGRALELRVEKPGAYRVEASLEVGGRARTWVLSNPVYAR
jgi:hypothetical protein